MADFCTVCSNNLFTKGTKPDIDIKEIFESLKKGYFQSGLLCEGCTLVGIHKTDKGELMIAYMDKTWWDFPPKEMMLLIK